MIFHIDMRSRYQSKNLTERLMLLSAKIQFSFFPLSLRCFDDENEALSFDLVLPLLWSMLRFSLELLDLIELDLLIDESTD